MTNKHNEWLREKIEKGINADKKRVEKFTKIKDYDVVEIYEATLYNNRWILSELDKMNCENCNGLKNCLSYNNYTIGTKKQIIAVILRKKNENNKTNYSSHKGYT